MSEPLLTESGNNAGLRETIEKNRGRTFVHRTDGTYTTDELARIEREFKESGKAFLCGRNGCESIVFGPHAHWLIPAAPKIPVTEWVRKFLRPLVAESGIFEELATAARAKIDERKSKMSGNVFFHTGDLGDIIAALPTVRALGGGYLILGNRHGRGGRELMTQARFDVIEPLLEAQNYITGVELLDDAPGVLLSTEAVKSAVTHDFTRFREHAPPQAKIGTRLLHGGAGYNLATWQASYMGVHDVVDLSPWVRAGLADEGIRNEARGKAIFARTERYHNPTFDWGAMVKEHSPALFVGLEEEWENFRISIPDSRLVGAEIRYRPCANLLEVAQLIAGSRLLVANQSCPCWIGMAMGHPLIQETDQWNLNSVVERTNAEYRM